MSSRTPRLHARPLADLTDKIIRDSPSPVAGGYASDIHKCEYHEKHGVPTEVAVKVFRCFVSQPSEEIEKISKDLQRELGIWRRLDDPNIIPLLGVANGFGPLLAAVLPWMSNGTLHSFLEKTGETLTVVKRLDLVYGIASGLDHLHSRRMFHGDMHSGNVLIDDEGNPRISDFGLSSTIGKLQPGLTYLQRRSRTAGAVRWAAPERLSGSEPASSSDMYSFGCIMLEVFSGDVPWKEEKNDNLLIFMKLTDHKPPSRPVGVEDAHWALMLKCWACPKQQRPTASGVKSEVRGFKAAIQRQTYPSDESIQPVSSLSLGAIRDTFAIPSYLMSNSGGTANTGLSNEETAPCPAVVCQWRDQGAPNICGNTVSCDGIRAHFARIHGIERPEEIQIMCRWGDGCFNHLKRHNFLRHIRESHLGHSRRRGHS